MIEPINPMEATMSAPSRHDYNRARKARLGRELEAARETEAFLADLPGDVTAHDLRRLQQSHDELRELLLTLIEDRALCRDRSDVVDRASSAWLRSALV
jgi:hypothetical protein